VMCPRNSRTVIRCAPELVAGVIFDVYDQHTQII